MNQESIHSLNSRQLEISVSEQKAIDRVFTKKRSRENYCKLSEEKNTILENWFKKIRYPKKEEYEAIAEEINEIVPKIENWFKHKRRKAMIEGNFNLYKRRRLLNEKEKTLLEEAFRVTMHPNKEKLHELAKLLKFSTKVISNWFSYRRKKFLRVNCFQQTSSKYGKKGYKNKKNFHDDSSPQSINLNGSGSNSDFSLPLNLKNDRQPTTNCTGPSESNQNSSNNNKSENTNENENERPIKAKKIHCEEQNRFNAEGFQSQQKEFNGSPHDYMKNCQNFTNFFIKNNNILPSMYQSRQGALNGSFSFAQGLNSLPGNSLQNFYPVNSNQLNIQNFPNAMNRQVPAMYTPVMVLGQECMLIPVLQQQVLMGYPAPTTSFYPSNSLNQIKLAPNGQVNYIQPMMNGFFQNNGANMNGMGVNHEMPRLEPKGEKE